MRGERGEGGKREKNCAIVNTTDEIFEDGMEDDEMN